ncbi:MAG: hypothetical protein KC931_15890, partial [Candidatus Omnitrophica bacterium]|nr:hypothetical protein [Candidatus Omnitrophota bacterium]
MNPVLFLFTFTFICLSVTCPGWAEPEYDPSLVGWWKLDGNAEDSTANGNDGIAHGVDFSDPKSAEFDGLKSHIEIPDADALDFGSSDFTISAWIRTEVVMGDLIGDILSKYDPEARKGFNLGVLDNAGVGAGQSNFRNLFFGTDDGQSDPQWIDRGRPGEAVFIMALTDFDGALYAGTYESGKDKTGRVYRYDGDSNWVDCGNPDPANSISAMAVYNGDLYAAASHYRAGGSSLEASENTTPGGRIYRYLGGADWELCGELEGHEAILGLVAYKGDLYASSLYHPAGLYRYKGGA